MVKKAVFAAGLVLLLFAVASLYVGGVATLTDQVVHLLRPGPTWMPQGSDDGSGWELFAETEHYRYYVRPGDSIPRWSMELAEDHLALACSELHIQFWGVIHYYKHPSQQDLYQVTGSTSTGVVLSGQGQDQPPELHSLSGYDPHEVMHVLAHTALGESPAFFDEGLATAFGWDWTPGESDVHARARVLLQQGRLVPLQRLLANWDFRSYQSYPAYTAAGSFVKYLLEHEEPEKLSALFGLDRFSQREEIEDRFAAVYGRPFYEEEADWRSALQAGALGVAALPSDAKDSNISLVLTGTLLLVATFVGAVLLIIAAERAISAAGRLFKH
jgi:hypothetical protein